MLIGQDSLGWIHKHAHQYVLPMVLEVLVMSFDQVGSKKFKRMLCMSMDEGFQVKGYFNTHTIVDLSSAE